MISSKLVGLLALVSATLLVLSFAPVSVDALVFPHVHDRQVHGQHAAAKRADGNLERRCQPRPGSSTSPAGTPAYSPPTASAPSSPPAYTPSSAPSAPSSAPTYAPSSAPTYAPSSAPPATTASPSSAAPSSSPSSSPSSGSGGQKMGLAYGADPSFLSDFARPRVKYVYTWSPSIPANAVQLGLEPVPMLWGPNQVADFQKLVVKGYANIVLGMNEPNEPSQSNMTPQDGANMWKQYIDPLKDQGYKLVSPACTDDDAGLTWYQQFFAACTGCHFDAIAFHAYTTSSQHVIDYATTLYNTYHLPIWLTEFADQNYSGTGGQASMDQVWQYASDVKNFVDNTDWLEAAFPFGVMTDLQGVNTDNALLGSDGKPTSLAYFYFG